jgi:hypothetical protein
MTHSPDQEDRSRLRQLLTRHFNPGELQTLCFELGVEYDDLPEGGRVDKIRELITHLERRGRIPDLIAVGRRLRPDVAWDAAAAPPDAAAVASKAPANPPPPPRQPAPNPFRSIGRITDPAAFVGRAALLHELFADLRRGINRALLGETQVGKSSILAMVRTHGPQQLGLPAANIIYLDLQLIRHEDEFFEALCLELGIAHCRSYRLARALRGQRYILCLDEIEKMRKERFSGDEREELRGLADGADAPLTLLVASRVTLEELFPDAPGKTSPLANICTPLPVPPFTPDEARLFLAHRLRGTGVTFTPAEIDDLVYRSGGHPARLQQAAEAVYQRYVGG